MSTHLRAIVQSDLTKASQLLKKFPGKVLGYLTIRLEDPKVLTDLMKQKGIDMHTLLHRLDLSHSRQVIHSAIRGDRHLPVEIAHAIFSFLESLPDKK